MQLGTPSHQAVQSHLQKQLLLPSHVVKDSPQPQDPLELGLLKVNSDLQTMMKQTCRPMYGWQAGWAVVCVEDAGTTTQQAEMRFGPHISHCHASDEAHLPA